MKLRSLLLIATFFASLCPAGLRASFIWAWGSNTNGATIVPADLSNAVAISAGGNHALAVRDDGTVVAWGNNDFGQCNVPTGLSNVVQVSAAYNYSLALNADGTVVAWGSNEEGQLNVPPDLRQVIAVAAGDWGGLALKASGTVVVWGGQGPYSGIGITNVPAGLTNAIAVSAWDVQAVVLRADGTVVAWGGGNGQAVVPPSLSNVVVIAAAEGYTIALGVDGTVTGWGYVSDTGLGMPPTPVTNILPAKLPGCVSISAGLTTALALRNDGTVLAWGKDTNLPPQLSAINAISAGGDFDLGGVYLAMSDMPQPKIPIWYIGPLSQTVAPGSDAFFSVRAGGSSLTYQWYFGTNALAGQTNRWLELYSVQGTQQGTYSVVVTGPAGSVTSQPVTLSVQTAVQVNMVPAISLSGLAPGGTYGIQYINAIGPTNTWTQLTTISLTNNPAFYFDTSAIGQPERLYRLVLLP